MKHRRLPNISFLFHNAAEKGILLLISMMLAIILSNSAYAPYYHQLLSEHLSIGIGRSIFTLPLREWINDFAMAVFFMVVGMEIKREMTGGHLATWPQRILPLVAATSGVIIPMLIFIGFNAFTPESLEGWAIPVATDIAFALAMFSMFGRGLPGSLRTFLAALAIIDDLMAVVIIALFYNSMLSPLYLMWIVLIVLALWLLVRLQYSGVALYILLGLALWYSFYCSGIHATVSGVIIGFMIPMNRASDDFSPLIYLEKILAPYVSYFILPVFAFANSGIDLNHLSWHQFSDTITLGVMLGLFVGKQVGIFGSVWCTTKLKLANLPQGADYWQFYGVAVLCGIGFTMSLFINILAYNTEPLYATSAQLGVLAGSALSVFWGGLVLYTIRFLRGV